MFRNIAQAIHLLGQTGQWELIARSYNLMAISSVNKGNVSAAMDYYLTGLNYCRKYGITKMEISIMQNLGNLYMEMVCITRRKVISKRLIHTAEVIRM